MSDETTVVEPLVKDPPAEVELEKALLEHAKEKGVPDEELPSDLKSLEAAEIRELKTSPLTKQAESGGAAEEPKKAPEVGPAEKLVEEKIEAPAPAKAEATPQEPPDIYKDIQLPPTAKGASAKAFAELKARAAADLQAKDKTIAELQEKLRELEEKTKQIISPEEFERLKKENEQLKEWQAKLDVEADPKWQEQFDQRIKAAEEVIYTQLKSAGASDEVIEKIKELGGPAEVDFEIIFQKLNNPTAQRLIQRKLDEIEEVKAEKQLALNQAKEKVKEYVEQRRKEFFEAANRHNVETEKELKQLLEKQEYLRKYDLKNAENDEERAQWEAHNKWVDEVHEVIKEAMSDTSPTMRALLIAGVAQYMYLRRAYQGLEKEKSALQEKIKSLEESLKEAQGRLTKVKEASLSAIRRTAATKPAEPPETPVSSLLNKTAEEAFEEYLRSRASE